MAKFIPARISPTPHALLAATYPDQIGALELALRAARTDDRQAAPTGRCYRPIVNLHGWVVGIYEDPFCGDRPNAPGFVGYLPDQNPPA